MGAIPELFLAGNLPPPLTGQAIATETLLGVFRDSGLSVCAADIGAPDATLRPGVGPWVQRSRQYLARRSHTKVVPPQSTVVWSSPSPTPQGLLRDWVLYRSLWNRSSPTLAVVHWGNFEEAFTSELTRPIAHSIYKNVSSLVTLSARLAQRLRASDPPCDVTWIPNTVRPDLEPCDELLEISVRERLAMLRSGRIVVGYLGRLMATKGYAEVIEGVGRIVAANGRQAVEMAVAGPWGSARDEREFASSAARLAPGASINLVGELPSPVEVSKFLQRIHVLALPTRYAVEAQPLVLLEAMAHGVPVVATNHAAMVDTLPSEPGGVTAGVEDVPKVLEQLSGSFLRDPREWEQASASSLSHYRANFSRETVAAKWISLLSDV